MTLSRSVGRSLAVVSILQRGRMNHLPTIIRPPALHPDALARCTWSQTEESEEGVLITLVDVVPDEEETLVLRQVWWFDRERGTWDLDESSEWFLPRAAAEAIAARLQHT